MGRIEISISRGGATNERRGVGSLSDKRAAFYQSDFNAEDELHLQATQKLRRGHSYRAASPPSQSTNERLLILRLET